VQEFLFYIFAAVAVTSAVAMITHRNPVYSAIFLIVTLFAFAGFFVLLNAPFVAAVHVIIYAGAIMVLFLFVIMLLNLKRDPTRETGRVGRRLVASVLVILLLVEVGALVAATYFVGGNLQGTPLVGFDSNIDGSTPAIGRQLFTTYLLPFEIASVLLLVGIIGAVVLAKRKWSEPS